MTTALPASSERRIDRELLVTGEAVALDVVSTTFATRVLSGAIDYAIYTLGLMTTMLTALFFNQVMAQANEGLSLTIVGLVFFSWMVAIPCGVEVLSKGRSAGRLVTGTRVVRDDGGAIRLRHSLVRTLVAVVEIWIMIFPALCSCLFSKRGKRLGDLLAGTYVVRERQGTRDGLPLIMPPELSSWAAGIDVRAIPGGLSLNTRTFLQRASGMKPEYRRRIGLELANQVGQYVAPPPPTGTHPERFLAAVMVERRNREYVLELRDRALADSLHAEMMLPTTPPTTPPSEHQQSL